MMMFARSGVVDVQVTVLPADLEDCRPRALVRRRVTVVTRDSGERPPCRRRVLADRVARARVRGHRVVCDVSVLPPVWVVRVSPSGPNGVPAPENTNAAPAPAPTPVFFTMMFAPLVFVHVHVTVSPGPTLIVADRVAWSVIEAPSLQSTFVNAQPRRRARLADRVPRARVRRHV